MVKLFCVGPWLPQRVVGLRACRLCPLVSRAHCGTEDGVWDGLLCGWVGFCGVLRVGAGVRCGVGVWWRVSLGVCLGLVVCVWVCWVCWVCCVCVGVCVCVRVCSAHCWARSILPELPWRTFINCKYMHLFPCRRTFSSVPEHAFVMRNDVTFRLPLPILDVCPTQPVPACRCSAWPGHLAQALMQLEVWA